MIFMLIIMSNLAGYRVARHLSRSDDQAFHWRSCFGAGKDIAAQNSWRCAQQVDRNSLDDGTYVGSRRKVPAVAQLGLPEARPIGNDPTTSHGPSREEH